MSAQSKDKNSRRPSFTGHQRAPLTSYYRGRPQAPGERSPFSRREAGRPIRRYAYGALDIIVVVVLLGGLVYSLLISPNPTVKANNLTFHSLAEYKTAAAAQLAHFDNRNKITFDESGLTTALKKQFPEISSVQVELPLFSEHPSIFLTIDRANFFLESQGIRYVIDSSGKAITKAANLPAVGNLPIINDTSGFAITPGRQVLSSSGVAFISTVIAQCRQANIKIASLTLPAVPQELDLKAKDRSYFVKFFLGGDVMSQAGQYLASRHHFDETNQQPSQYLDVRVDGKVFYK